MTSLRGWFRRSWLMWALAILAVLVTALAGPGGSSPAEPMPEEDPQWVGLPPAPGVLFLDPIPETEEDLAAELANEAAPPPGLPPSEDPPFQPDLDIFIQPSPEAGQEFESFDPEAPAE